MSRDIKFRAWNSAENHMYYGVGISPHTADYRVFDAQGAIQDMYGSIPALMQFTGLFDRLKVGIYEDDIVRVEGASVGVIEYSGAEFIIRIGNNRIGLNDLAPMYIEIIGNIHENANLLQEQPA
jgi:hypothetical protein